MSCQHSRIIPLGTRQHFGLPCPTTEVPVGRYLAHQCAACRDRIDVCVDTGRRYTYSPEILRARDYPAFRPGTGDNPRAVYTPQFDGVEAATDNRRPWASDFVAVWA